MNGQPILLEMEDLHQARRCEDDGVLRRDEPCSDGLIENTLIINTGSVAALTKRESEILRMIVGGRTNKQIARLLSRSERTVEYHRNRLMRKMAAHNTAELVRLAMVTGIV
jgi:DNA-binding CsgD family transcriptional regulator